MVDEGRSIVAVGGCTRFLHSLGHSRRTTGEDSNLWKMVVLFLKVVKEPDEVGSSEMGHSLQSSEEGAIGDLLEVTLTDVLEEMSVNALSNTSSTHPQSLRPNTTPVYTTRCNVASHLPTWLF